jgi:hypothetical protein
MLPDRELRVSELGERAVEQLDMSGEPRGLPADDRDMSGRP